MDSILDTPSADPAPAPEASPASPASDASPAPAATPGSSPPPFLGEGLAMNFEGLGPHLSSPDERAGLDGLKDRFDGKPVTELVFAFRHAEGELTRLKQSSALPDEPTLEGYGIQKPEHMSDKEWEDATPEVEEVLRIAHEAGIGRQGFQRLREWQLEREAKAADSATEAAKAQVSNAYNTLVDAWGTEFDAKRETANNHVQARVAELELPADDPSTQEHLQQLYNNPVFIRMMHLEATDPRRGGVEGSTVLPSGAATPVSDAEKAHDIMTNPGNPLHEKFVAESKNGRGPTIDYVEKLRSKLKRPRGL